MGGWRREGWHERGRGGVKSASRGEQKLLIGLRAGEQG